MKICPNSKYVGETLDLDNCIECLKGREICIHSTPRFNTVKIRELLVAERNVKNIFTMLNTLVNNPNLKYGKDNTS